MEMKCGREARGLDGDSFIATRGCKLCRRRSVRSVAARGVDPTQWTRDRGRVERWQSRSEGERTEGSRFWANARVVSGGGSERGGLLPEYACCVGVRARWW
ncbi:hypothetical protein BHE74_00003444 [Ensete ventricosum]|nr:hypothetical protein GW17_00002455 [Ensete ventricosum]RWW87710.1 hypothetical protein BHE74_00003444 [Ensete ventricosum]